MNVVRRPGGRLQPRVSVVMPFLDPHPTHLEEAINSLLDQTFEDWELILVNDSSDQPATALAASYQASHREKIRLLSPEGLGPSGTSAARNRGISESEGEYVALLDADDIYLRDRLARHVEILDRTPEAAMVFGDTLHWYGWGDPPERGDEHRSAGVAAGIVEPPLLLYRFLRGRGESLTTCSLTVRRSAITEVGGFEHEWTGLCDTNVFTAKLFANFPSIYSPGLVAKYRRHPDSMCRRATHETEVEARRKFVEWVMGYAGRELEEPVRSDVTRACRSALWQLDHPRAGDAIRIFWKASRRVGALLR
ncbi:MAG: glycosyltransferase family A protein [Gemmatimonadota bacterium]